MAKEDCLGDIVTCRPEHRTLAPEQLRPFYVEIWLAESSLDQVLRRSVDDNVCDEESDEVWRGMNRSSRHGSFAHNPHPTPLPEGEGGNNLLLINALLG